jgi:hypothetical protein
MLFRLFAIVRHSGGNGSPDLSRLQQPRSPTCEKSPPPGSAAGQQPLSCFCVPRVARQGFSIDYQVRIAGTAGMDERHFVTYQPALDRSRAS